jgi:hypothetical protein
MQMLDQCWRVVYYILSSYHYPFIHKPLLWRLIRAPYPSIVFYAFCLQLFDKGKLNSPIAFTHVVGASEKANIGHYNSKNDLPNMFTYFSSLIMQLFKIWFLEILNKYTMYIYIYIYMHVSYEFILKFLRSFILLT